ncbi:MAG: hypothetical protein QXQ68_08970 [Candidatus Nitrosocaldaceae archaeon]
MSKVDSTQPQLEGLEFEAREYLIRYYTCARPECRYRTELLEKAREHEREHELNLHIEVIAIRSM